MVILGVDTALRGASMAVYDTESMSGIADIAAHEVRAPLDRSTCECMLPMMKEALGKAGKRLADVDIFAAAAGPGSFTGLRIGCAFMQGLAYSAGKKCRSVTTLFAAPWSDTTTDRDITVLMDAKGGSLYAAAYRIENGRVSALLSERCCTPQEFEAAAPELSGACVTLDAGVERLLSDSMRHRLDPRPDPVLSGGGISMAARLCAACAACAQDVEPFELRPVYLRLSTPELAKKPKL